MPPIKSTCLTCGKSVIGKPSRPRKYCSLKCNGVGQRQRTGVRGVNWQGGRRRESGYVTIYVGYNHPMAPKGRPYVREHRLVMAHHLGRMLEDSEIIHHVNGDKADNRIENLRLMTNSEHTSLHGAGRDRSLGSWSRQHDRCTSCGTQERDHQGHGLCVNCYANDRNARLREQASIRS